MSRRPSSRVPRSPPTPSSILKRPAKTRPTVENPKKVAAPRVKFTLPHCQKVQSILQEFVEKQRSRDYENILCLIRDAEMTDDDVSGLLQEATECVSILNNDLRLFVEAVLCVEWSDKSEGVVAEYQSFIVNLLAAHNYHAKLVIDKLVKLFLPNPSDAVWIDGDPSEEDRKKIFNLHTLLQSLLEVVPMCKELLLKAICGQFPYYNKPTHTHEYYLYNVLNVLTYQPVMRPVILELIYSKLVVMDVNAPREEIEKFKSNCEDDIFDMDFDAKSVKTSSTALTKVNRLELANCLDICMDRIFDYTHKQCYDIHTNELDLSKSKGFFEDMMSTFEQVILPTYDTHHVQYVMFYLCSFQREFAEQFVAFLWKFSRNPNKAPILRQSAVNYLASFLARSNFINFKLLKHVLQDLAEWIHSYISTQDELGPINSDVRMHRVFYTMCQALFYIVAFRHKDFVDSRKRIMFLQNLNMGRMVTSKLNPFRVCQTTIVQNFAAIARNYQLAYCYSVIEHNARNKLPTVYQTEQGSLITTDGILDCVFPFDPYILEKSGKRVGHLYREYQEFDEEPTAMEVEENEDFFYQNEAASTSNSHRFSYGSSPGFYKS